MSKKNKRAGKIETIEEVQSETIEPAFETVVNEEPSGMAAIDREVLQEKIRQKANRRLASLDALRGLNMLCIIGLASLIAALCNLHSKDFQVFGNNAVKAVASFRQHCPGISPEAIKKQMDHVSWNGLRHHDTIFPLFLFLAGVSFPFSYMKQRANGRPMWRVCWKIFWRGLALFIAGYIYQNKLCFDFPNQRFMGVLQHIGLAWMFAAFIYLATARRIKTQIGIVASILIIYWLVVALVPARDVARNNEYFSGKAFQQRLGELFAFRAPIKGFDPAAKAAAQAPAPEGEAASDATANAAEKVATKPARPDWKDGLTNFKGLLAATFDEQPLPDFNSPEYPEIGTVDHNLLPEGCVVNYIDRQFTPGRLYHDHDNARAKMVKPRETKKTAAETAKTEEAKPEEVAAGEEAKPEDTAANEAAKTEEVAANEAAKTEEAPAVETITTASIPEYKKAKLDKTKRARFDWRNYLIGPKYDYTQAEYDPGVWRNMRDPEGLASTFPAIATALLGMLFGGVLRREDANFSKWKKVLVMFGWGIVLLLVGFLWHMIFPINKNLWNSSFVCFVGGYSAIAMGTAYLLIDVFRMRWLGFPFAVVGMNSIGIFLIKRIVDFTNVRNFFFADAIKLFVPNQYVGADGSIVEVGNFQSIATTCAGLLVSWLFLFWLYKKRIFFKI